MNPGRFIGKVVLYTNLGDNENRYVPEQHPAFITEVDKETDDTASLMIFYQTGIFIMAHVPYSSQFAPGHWSDLQ